jgi:transposase-like protein
MTKTGSKYGKTTSGRRTAKAAAKVVAVKKAAQRPTHASRAMIRRVVRSVAASQGANA